MDEDEMIDDYEENTDEDEYSNESEDNNEESETARLVKVEDLKTIEEDQHEDEEEHDASDDEEEVEPEPWYNLWPQKDILYKHMFKNVQEEGQRSASAQVNMKQGLRLFGGLASKAIRKEMEQLHNRSVMNPLQPSEVTDDIRRNALPYLMFLKRKGTRAVK